MSTVSEPSVSCIITYHNGIDTIARAVQSVIHQNFCLEVILVSDGANVPLTAEFYQTFHTEIEQKKLKIFELTTNVGAGGARNIGVAMSHGKYLSFLDQDDIYLPDIYREPIAFLEKNKHIAGLVLPIEVYEGEQLKMAHDDPRLKDIISTVVWNLILRRNVFWQSGGFPLDDIFRTPLGSEDIAFRWGLQHNFKIQIVLGEKKYVRHYVHAGNSTDRYLKRTAIKEDKVIFTDPTFKASPELQKTMFEHLNWANAMLEDSTKCSKNH